MKNNKAEEIIRRKISEQESDNSLIEDHASLWSALSARLEEKEVVPSKRHYYPLWAAASVVFLLILGLFLYPKHKLSGDQQTAAVQPAVISTPLVSRVQEKEKVKPVQAQAVAVQTHKKAASSKRKIDEPEKKEQEAPSADYAGLYSMPQIACAEVQAAHYPLCSQTL
ncbi:MAG TPA: hypothetical protein VL092_09070 [Chitinophagaceae bacterium]|nr:hypothetical protein [Chitinophagaceae bacterium]